MTASIPRELSGRQGARRPGTILVAVLLVVTISALAASVAMYYGEAAAAGSEVTLRRTRSRAMAWSGVQALMAELDAQRDKLLDGEAPLVTTQWQAFESSGRRGIVRLVAMERDDSGLERWVVSENAKIDLNRATTEMLAKVGPLGEQQASAIVAARDKGFGSVEELVRVPGVAELLGQREIGDEDFGPASGDVDHLESFLTVFSFDPNVQSGIDPGGADAKGKLRVNLNVQWSEELANAISARFGAAAANSAKALFDSGAKFKTIADVAGALKKANLPPSSWAPFLDAFTLSPDPYLPGKVDLNRASASVLAAIPGFSRDSADEVVRRRASLDAAVRRSIAWPLSEGILNESDFVIAADWLTTRSLQWRARVEVGVVGVASEDSGRSAKLDERMVVEVVIDVASERPRVAYLRDVSLSDTAAILATEAEAVPEEAGKGALGADVADIPSNGAKLEMDASLKMSSALDFGHPPMATTVPSNVAAEPTAAAVPVAPQDRRIGRWTSRTSLTTETSPVEPKP